MRTWDYRIFENLVDVVDGQLVSYDVCEVVYDDNGDIEYIYDILSLSGDTLKDVEDLLEGMCKAKEKPVITWEEYNKYLDKEMPF